MEKIENFWREYLDSLPPDSDLSRHTYTAWSFGNYPALADELGELVRAGTKTATCAMLREMEFDDEPILNVGDISIILNSTGIPLCIIETSEVIIQPFNEVDEKFANAEGEGDRTYKTWREEHWRYFSRICKKHGWEPSENMLLVCERFRLLYRKPTEASSLDLLLR